jgi:Peptidase family S41
MRASILLIVTLWPWVANCQTRCDCTGELNLVLEKVEANSASYADQVLVDEKSKEYKKHRAQARAVARTATTPAECLSIIAFYLSFLDDTHQRVYTTDSIGFGGNLTTQQFLKQSIENRRDLVSQGGQVDTLEGIWHDKATGTSIRIIRSKTKGRSYIGVVTNESHPHYSTGDVVLSVYRNVAGLLVATFLDQKLQPRAGVLKIQKNQFSIGLSTMFERAYRSELTVTPARSPSQKVSFQELDSKWSLLRIPSFKYQEQRSIDSVLQVNNATLASAKNLIIDLRGNTGGSDFAYSQLLPFVLDTSHYVHPYAASIWVSIDNLDAYDAQKYMYGVHNNSDSVMADRRIEELRNNLGRFQPHLFWTNAIELASPSPRRIVILVNRRTASSAEGFILTALQSKKVVVAGENTAGAMSYGDWMPLKLHTVPAWISITRSRMVFYNGKRYENVGITPHIRLSQEPGSDWIPEVMKVSGEND